MIHVVIYIAWMCYGRTKISSISLINLRCDITVYFIWTYTCSIIITVWFFFTIPLLPPPLFLSLSLSFFFVAFVFLTPFHETNFRLRLRLQYNLHGRKQLYDYSQFGSKRFCLFANLRACWEFLFCFGWIIHLDDYDYFTFICLYNVHTLWALYIRNRLGWNCL